MNMRKGEEGNACWPVDVVDKADDEAVLFGS